MSEQSLTTAEQGTSPLPQAGGAAVWNQPGFAGLWGLATAKDSLRYWLKSKSFHTAALARWLFTILFVMALLNGFFVLNRIITAGSRSELPTYPYLTIFVLLAAMAMTKERSRGIYIWSAWIFWIIYTLLGFVNPTGITEENFRLMIQSIGKTWIGLIAIPWIAFRVISPDQLPRYTSLLIYTVAVGSILSFLQLWNPALFSYVRGDSSLRAGGTWMNANVAGMVFMQSLLIIRLGNWPQNWVKWLMYLIILAGLIATFSRGSLFSYVAGMLVYLTMIKSYKRILLSITFLLMFLGSWIILGVLVQNNTITIQSKEIRQRTQTFNNMFSSKIDDEIATGRMYLWKAGIQEVLDDGSLLFGLGHIGMAKTKSLGLAPHNEYIAYFADGGLLGLAAFLAFLGMIAYSCYRCKDSTIRATLISMIVAHAFFCMSGDKIFLQQPIGPFIALIALWAHYSRDYPGEEKVQRLKRSMSRQVAVAQLSSNPSTVVPR
jgi:O-antigen ligase